MTDSDHEAKPTLPEKVLSWMETSGYGLEMRVGRSLQTSVAGLQTQLGAWYLDPETRKEREIDVVGQLTGFSKEAECHWRLSIVVECKGGRTKPWVVMRDAGTYGFATAVEVSQRYLSRATNPVQVENMMQKWAGCAIFPASTPGTRRRGQLGG